LNLIVLIAAGAVALAGQGLNRYKGIPNWAVKGLLVLAGVPFYMWSVGLPPAWWGPQFEEWSMGAVIWAFALPGMASTIGLHPAMKTDSVE
jgi:hypothetical protein